MIAWIYIRHFTSWSQRNHLENTLILHLSRALYKLFILIKRTGWFYRSILRQKKQYFTGGEKNENSQCYPGNFKIFKHFNNISLSNITQTSSRPLRIPFEIIKKLSLEKFRFSFSPHTRDIILLYPFNNAPFSIFEGVTRVNFTQALKVLNNINIVYLL